MFVVAEVTSCSSSCPDVPNHPTSVPVMTPRLCPYCVPYLTMHSESPCSMCAKHTVLGFSVFRSRNILIFTYKDVGTNDEILLSRESEPAEFQRKPEPAK